MVKVNEIKTDKHIRVGISVSGKTFYKWKKWCDKKGMSYSKRIAMWMKRDLAIKEKVSENGIF